MAEDTSPTEAPGLDPRRLRDDLDNSGRAALAKIVACAAPVPWIGAAATWIIGRRMVAGHPELSLWRDARDDSVLAFACLVVALVLHYTAGQR